MMKKVRTAMRSLAANRDISKISKEICPVSKVLELVECKAPIIN